MKSNVGTELLIERPTCEQRTNAGPYDVDPAQHDQSLSARLCRADCEIDRSRQPIPRLQLLLEVGTTGTGERVELHVPAGVGPPDARGDPSLTFQTIERGIERPLRHLQHVSGYL